MYQIVCFCTIHTIWHLPIRITNIKVERDLLNNKNCSQIMRDLEKTMVGAKVAMQREIFVTPTKKGLSFPGLETKKPRKLPTRAKGVGG